MKEIIQKIDIEKIKALIGYKAQDIHLKPVVIGLGGRHVVISIHALAQGVLASLCIYLSIFFVLTARSDQTINDMNATLASSSLPVVSEEQILKKQREMEQKIEARRKEKEAMREAGEYNSLPEAPIAGLHYEGSYGTMPKVDVNKRLSPYEAYKRPFFNYSNTPIISLIMADYGISSQVSDRALQILPNNVTVLLSPYSHQAGEYMAKARADGHEVWLELPLETKEYPNSDPGPQAILSRMSQRYNMDQLEWTLSRAAGYTGVVAHSDDIFDNAEPMFRSILREIYDAGLLVFESNIMGGSDVVEKTAKQNALPYMKADIDIDDPRWNGNRAQAFELLETVASGKGRAVAIFQPYPENLVAIDGWIRGLEQNGYKLAPLSAALGPLEMTGSMVEKIRIKQEQDELNKALPKPVVVKGMPAEAHGESKSHGSNKSHSTSKPAAEHH